MIALALATGPSDSGLIIAIIASITSGGGLAAGIQWLANRGKSSAEEAEIWTRSNIARLQTMHNEMTLLEDRLQALNNELDQERAARIAAETELRKNGIPWTSPRIVR